ncbi:MAG TPA: gluconate:H+ symporter [Bryobacteraceae bacterium]|nr:gluconate:H+ symporter [Bryobacteraceae bacterium]
MHNGIYLALITIVAIALLLVLVLYARLHAFLALFVVSMALGLAAGMPPGKVLTSMQFGVGDALSFIAVVVGLGAIIGRFIQYSDGGRVLADWLLARTGREHAPWAVLIAAFLVGLPVFFEVGFIILAPLAWSLARESKRSLLLFGLPIAGALTITHALVPPHPAPAVAAQLMGADVGRTILYGALLSVPLMVIGGIFYGRWISGRISPPIPAIAGAELTRSESQSAPPSLLLTVSLLLLPVLLILGGTVSDVIQLPGRTAYKFLGHPFTALLITALAAMLFLGRLRGLKGERITKVATEALAPLATLLLIISGGGALKQIIVDSGIGPYLGKLLAGSPLSPLLVCFLTSAGLRAAQGSATVAIVTAAGILAPLMKQVHGYTPEMLVLAVCCGGTMISHVNDAGFWLVKEYMGMTVAETLRSWTGMKIVMGVIGIAVLLIWQSVFFRR